ncbi:sorting nexin-14-like [Lytechinus variegatus]|nr:sorting nexin-14-like [Lytechinus variegatus]
MKLEGGKEGFVFIIGIQRIDVREGDGEKNSWQVERRYHEFYALEQKLREFHGVFEDAQLPVRRPFGSKSHDFMEKKRPGLEKYLRVLLTKPILRGSQLLYTFLTTNEEFVNKIFGDVNLGKFVRSVSTKVIKERGQHLEPFLVTFLASVEAAKPKARTDEFETDPNLTDKEMLSNVHFENNANQVLDRCNLKEPWANPEANYLQLTGIIQYILYLARSVLDVPVWMHQMTVTFAKIFGNSLETYVDYFVNTKTDLLKTEQMVEHIIHLLRDVLFFDDDPPRTDAQKLERKEFAFEQMLKFFPSIVPKVLGEEKFYDGCKTVFDSLQYPKLNKQLSYILLDIVIKEIFPELSDDDDTDEEAPQYQEDHYEKD